MAKRALSTKRMARLINHGPTVIVSSRHGTRTNLITLAWTSPVSIDPPMVAVAIAPGRYSHGLISRSKEYVINVPGSGLLDAVWYCGTRSGKSEDKFEGAGLTAVTACAVAAPLVDECFGHLECRVVKTTTTGDHTLFIGEVVAASVESEAFGEHLHLARPFHTLHHLGGPRFLTTAGTRLVAG
jgi:flavin reductase (DIM6/NTAB) family NADH-FMN oxidoreductase RutF